MGLFRGDPDRHARMWVDRLGRRGYAAVHAPIVEQAWRAHLEGTKTLALVLSEEGRFHAGVIDVDLSRLRLEAVKNSLPDLLIALRAAHDHAVGLQRAAGRLGLETLLEDSGQKGRHVWLFFEPAAPARDVFLLLRKVVDEAGEPPEGISVDLIPADSRRPTDGTPIVTLPLGIHLQSGRRSLLLEPGGHVIDPLDAHLRRVRPCVSEAMRAALEVRSLEPEPAEHIVPGGVHVAAVLAGCPVAAHLVEKAAAIGHLHHRERLTLLHVFGHFGQEGATFLHHVMARCADYDPRITDRYLEKLKDAPVSCARVREWLPEVTTRVPCCCRFVVPRGAWPTPVLHAVTEWDT